MTRPPVPWQATAGTGARKDNSVVTATRKRSDVMGVRKWIQDRLPIFQEPILPGDLVKVTQILFHEDHITSEITDRYVGMIGQVEALEGDALPYLVRFDDGVALYFHLDELEAR